MPLSGDHGRGIQYGQIPFDSRALGGTRPKATRQPVSAELLNATGVSKCPSTVASAFPDHRRSRRARARPSPGGPAGREGSRKLPVPRVLHSIGEVELAEASVGATVQEAPREVSVRICSAVTSGRTGLGGVVFTAPR